MSIQPRLLVCLRWALVGLFIAVALAQAPTGSISGTLHDASGAVVPNAAITLTARDTGLVRNLLTGIDGSYSAPALPPGRYEIKASLPGFRTVLREATVETGAIT